jgi:3-keto-5-aminohexanoate cleavage enzyme
MSYEEYIDGEPLIITVAPTGGVHGKESHPDLPETPEEIAETAVVCERAGASVIHLHARHENGERAFSRERFQELTKEVRKTTEGIVIQHSTGGTGVPLEERLQPLRTDPTPEMASLDMGPVNRYQHLTSKNPRGMVDALYEEMSERNIKPEMEVFNPGHLNEVEGFLDRTEVASPLYLGVLFGGGTLTPAHPRNLLNVFDNLPDGAILNTLATGRHQLPLTTMSVLLGGHVRVGLEDNLYFKKGELAESNAQLVERVRDIAELLGRPVATPEATREILGL